MSLEADGMVTIKRTSDGTVVTIVKYSTFQDKRPPKRTSNSTTHSTPDGTTVGTQTINGKEMQKEIKEKGAAHISVESAAPEEEEEIVGLTKEEWDALGDDI